MKEEWLDIPGYEGFYQASNIGRLRSIGQINRRKGQRKNGVILKPHSTDYSRIGIFGKSLYVHRLVAITFIPNPDNKPDINHKNGIKTDNRVENLEWVTVSENQRHAYRTGLHSLKGSRHPHAKLDELSVRVIRETIAAGHPQKDIAKYFGVSQNAITHIKKGRTWPHVK